MQPNNSAFPDDPSPPAGESGSPAPDRPTPEPAGPTPQNQTEPVPSARGKGSAKAVRRAAETGLKAREMNDAAQRPKVPYRRREWSLADRVLLLLANVGAVWKRLLRGVRSQLPRPWQAQLSDQVLSAILLGLLFLLLTLGHPLGRSQPSRVAQPAPEVAQAQPAAPELPALPAPPLEVSPEQTRIADIQEQVAEITQTYATGLIQSVRANFQQGWLKVDLGPQWYNLVRSHQEQMAQDLYKRAQELSFSKLYLLDDSQNLVARNPVVGQRMVILKSAATGGQPV